jgi:hypothetical protein
MAFVPGGSGTIDLSGAAHIGEALMRSSLLYVDEGMTVLEPGPCMG